MTINDVLKNRVFVYLKDAIGFYKDGNNQKKASNLTKFFASLRVIKDKYGSNKPVMSYIYLHISKKIAELSKEFDLTPEDLTKLHLDTFIKKDFVESKLKTIK